MSFDGFEQVLDTISEQVPNPCFGTLPQPLKDFVN